jgi:tetratricopeptide (TPR) repeat protein
MTNLSKPGVDDDKNLMRQVSGGAEVALNSPESERIFARFRANLGDIVHAFRAHGVPVILGDISSNLMFPPFAPGSAIHPDPLPQAIAAGRFGEADSIIMRGLVADSSNAYFLYWGGRLRLAAGDSVLAMRYLERARDNDLLKFRAPGRINEIIHQTGVSESVPVLPIDSLLRAHSPHGITDETLFSEHLHPTFAGYDLIARTFVGAIVDQHPGSFPQHPDASLLPFHPDSLSVPWLDLGYGALGMRALTSRWPFSDMPVHKDALDQGEAWELKIVKDLYGGSLGWRDACLQYAYEAHRHQKPEAMVTALAAVVEEDPWTYAFRYGLAGALESVGRKSEAIGQYRRALLLKPDFYQAKVDLADLLVREGRMDEADDQLQEFFDTPWSATAPTEIRVKALFGLASVAASHDSIQASLELLDEALRLAPGHADARDLRKKLLRRVQ